MRKYNLFIVLAISLVVALVGCKKDEVEPKGENALKMEGQWQLKSVNFLSDELDWDEEVPYTFGNYFKYAPAMYEDLKGFDFRKTKTDGNEGYSLQYINEGNYNADTDAPSRWYWNYLNEKTGFEMLQINEAMPPYNFSIMDITDIKVSNKGNTITFKAKAYTRLSGAPASEVIVVSAEYKMERGTAVDNTEVYINGILFELTI
ncbi:MAG TPA: hypothetical protein VL021_04290 [Brumimicrobium sp.]|nr:hypothetical protein [Brumimicrobium sp.]